MIQKNDSAAWLANAMHLVSHRDGIRDDADEIGSVNNIERAGLELQVGGIHLQQPDILYGFPS